ncbi:hypothetical protein DL96DRAFT_1707144 [Flagelloscypha sp. PMI_526]|nr:hypothetical protein DL96DRAFT_1707144 [Flagelloscypha sp. PMI_526]
MAHDDPYTNYGTPERESESSNKTPRRSHFKNLFGRTSSSSNISSTVSSSQYNFPGSGDTDIYLDETLTPPKRSFRVLSRPESSGNLKFRRVSPGPESIPPVPSNRPPEITLQIPPPPPHSPPAPKPLPDIPPVTPISPGQAQPPSATSLLDNPYVKGSRKSLSLSEDKRVSLSQEDTNLQRSVSTRSHGSTNHDDNPTNTVESAVEEAFHAAHTDTQLSKPQAMFDRILDHGTDAFTKVNDFYTSNSDTIASAASNLASANTNIAQFEDAVSGFTDVAKTLITGLDALAQLHPFVGIAVQAFKMVIQFDLQRRDNNKKVFVVKLQMQDMVTVLFELRTIKDSDQKGPDGQTIEARMQSLIKKIAKAIKEGGSAIDIYLGKSLISKTLKAMKYQGMLAEIGAQYDAYKKEIKFALQMHTAHGVDKANAKLDDQKKQMAALESKLGDIMDKLDSFRERDMKRFIASRNGPKAVIDDPVALKALVQRSGEGIAAATGGKLGKSEDDNLETAKLFLQKELQESIESERKKNLARFEGKLVLMEQRLTDTIHNEGSRVIEAVQDGAHKDIDNETLRAIWKDMGWRGASVKARHFILALHDHFSEKIREAELIADNQPNDKSEVDGLPEDGSDGEGSESGSEEETHPDPPPLNFADLDEARRLDTWALNFLTVTHVQSILEAIDDDGTGFITVKEVNIFVKSRPPGWTLPFYIAWWGIGWHVSITIYRARIYRILQQMFTLIPKSYTVTVGEQRKADREDLASDPTLRLMVESYMDMELQNLEKRLDPINYNLDSEAVVRTSGYIPSFIFFSNDICPILKIACTHNLSYDELEDASTSLTTLDTMISNRIAILEAIFKQTHSDISSRFENYAFGMFQSLYDNDSQDMGEDCLIQDFYYEDFFWREDQDSEEDESPSLDILQNGPESIFVDYDEEWLPAPPDPNSYLAGTWSGHFLRAKTEGESDYESPQGSMSLTLEPEDWGMKSSGIASTYSGDLTVEFQGTKVDMTSLEFTIRLTYDTGDQDYNITGVGILDLSREVMTGTWEMTTSNELARCEHEGYFSGKSNQDTDSQIESDAESDDTWETESNGDAPTATVPSISSVSQRGPTPGQVFYFTRTPPSVMMYRYSAEEFEKNPARARWRFACDAICHQVREHQLSWSRILERRKARQRAVEIGSRALLHMREPLPGHSGPPKEELDELASILSSLAPIHAAYFVALAEDKLEERSIYGAYAWCDNCWEYIYRQRIICIECVEERFSDAITICVNCLPEASVEDRELVHLPEHTTTIVHTPSCNNMFVKRGPSLKQARTTMREKRLFHSDASDDDGALTGPPCLMCDKNVTLPFWYCDTCEPSYICDECFVTGCGLDHDPSHCVVRFAALSLEQNLSIDERMIALEGRMVRFI